MEPERRIGMGELRAIWLKRSRRGPMDPVETAELNVDGGLVGDANPGGRRQLTIIERERWEDALSELGERVDPSARRANLMVEGVDLRETRGRVLRIGDCRLQIQGETKPCHRMDEARQGLQAALRPDWRGGAFATVLSGGDLRVGQAAAWEEG
jgi:MOSC domain-containing protein YiiM